MHIKYLVTIAQITTIDIIITKANQLVICPSFNLSQLFN